MVKRYYDVALETGNLYAFLGAALWITTFSIAFKLGSSQDTLYHVVGILTLVAGATVWIDFAGNRWITPITVASGSAALLIGQSLWFQHRGDGLRTALFVVQVAAVGIQIGAIANSKGRGPLDTNDKPTLVGPLLG